MSEQVFYVVDVFALGKYTGNQLAVFRQAGGLSDKEMQSRTREMNFSETTFILSDNEKDGGFQVRIFTPGQEVPYAGHPTLGTAFIIQQEIIKKPVESITLNLKVGQIPVAFGYEDGKAGILWMKPKMPVFGNIIGADVVAPVLSIGVDEIDHRFPIQVVSTGLPTLIIPLKTLESVKRCRTNKEKYFDLVEKIAAETILVFAAETYHSENDLNVRVFVDYFGIPEDPATGSGNGCLAGYLAKHKYFGKGKIDIRVEQGYEINRPSLLLLRAEESAAGINVQVGGRVVLVAKGEWR